MPSPPIAASQTSLLSGWPARDPPIGRATGCVYRVMTATARGAMLATPSLWELTKMAVVATARIDSGRASWPELVLPAISLVAAPMLLIEGIIYRFQTEDPTQLSGF